MDAKALRHWLLAGSIAVVFLSFGIWELIDPSYWSAFVPAFVAQSFNVLLIVRMHGVVLALLGVWLLTDRYMQPAAILSALVLVEIVVSLLIESGFTDLFVRDLGLLLAAGALIADSYAQ